MFRPMSKVYIWVVTAALFNYFLVGMLGGWTFALNIGRIAISLLGGWFIVISAGRGLWAATAIGPLVMLIDHVILKGGFFVLLHFLSPATVEGNGLLAAGGVVVSFFMFAPISAVISLLGGVVAKTAINRQ